MKIFVKIAILLLVGVLTSSVTAKAAEYAIVAKRTIYPGQMIYATDLKAVKLIREPQIRYRFVSQFEEIVGQQAKRTILPGRFIKIGSAQPAPLVKAGALKRVQFSNGALAISVVCVALSDAGAGDMVRMRNPSSGKIFTAQVRADGTLITGAL